MAKAVDSTPIVLQICTPLQVVAPFIILVVFYRIMCYNPSLPLIDAKWSLFGLHFFSIYAICPVFMRLLEF